MSSTQEVVKHTPFHSEQELAGRSRKGTLLDCDEPTFLCPLHKAAPELLEALQNLLIWNREGHTQKTAEKISESHFQIYLREGSVGVNKVLIEEAHAAIAKAIGGAQ